jgi:hypothetical protein
LLDENARKHPFPSHFCIQSLGLISSSGWNGAVIYASGGPSK